MAATITAPTAARMRGWEHRLADFIERQGATSFAWGTGDCLTTIADLANVLTGHNPVPAHQRRYRTELGALRQLARVTGSADIEAALAYHFAPVPPAMARRGDCGIVMTAGDGEPAKAAVIVLGATVLGRGPTGAIVRPRRDLVSAYRIG